MTRQRQSDLEKYLTAFLRFYRQNPLIGTIGLVLVAVAIGALFVFGSKTAEQSEPGTPSSLSAQEATAALEQLEVRSGDGATGYDRDSFGSSWADSAGSFEWSNNGCDTRNDVLARDLTQVKKEGDCEVLSGILAVEPYTGTKNYEFDKSKGSAGDNALDIEHLVALGDAYRSGADKLNSADRAAIANDPINLLAVNPSENRKKGDKNASEYLPPNENFHCSYVAAQIQVKTKYNLNVSQQEKEAMQSVLNRC